MNFSEKSFDQKSWPKNPDLRKEKKQAEDDARLARAEANPQDPENQRYLQEQTTAKYREKALDLMRNAPRLTIRERWAALADAMDANDVDKAAKMLEDQARSTVLLIELIFYS